MVDSKDVPNQDASSMNYDPSTMSLLKLEKDLIIAAEQYPSMIEQACTEHNPSVIANYVFI